MKLSLASATLLIACNCLRAGELKPATNAAPGASTAVYKPKTLSSFTGTASQHNPFWPIGWVKTENVATTEVAVTTPHPEDFEVTTILLNDPPMAVINGKAIAEGEVAGLPVAGRNVVVQLMAVQDGRVILRWENQNMVVPLHRNEELHGSVTALR